MAKKDEDLKNKNLNAKLEENVNKTSDGTKSARKKDAETKNIVEDAKKALVQNNNQEEKTTKKKKATEDKGLSAYEEQALQGVTKSKGNKKLLIILLLLVFLIVAGVGVALFFILKPEEEDVKAVVCQVEVLSYRVDITSDPEEYIAIGSGDKFNFTKETQTTSSFTKDVDETITDEFDFAMTYLINNVTENEYSYTLNFSNFQISNCDVVVKINNGSTYSIDDVRKVITISQLGDVVLEVRISGKNPPAFDENDIEGWHNSMLDWATNTWCDGSIDLTLEVN